MKANYGTELYPSTLTIYIAGKDDVEIEFTRCDATGDHVDVKIGTTIWYPEEWDAVSEQIREAITYMMSYGMRHEKDMYITKEAEERQKRGNI